MFSRFCAISLLIGAVVPTYAAGPPTAESIALKFDGTSITATGIAPHATVFFFGITREKIRFTPIVARVEKMIVDDDGDGIVSFDYGRTVPPDSVWAVVDTTNGRRGTGTPKGPAAPLLLEKEPVVINNGQLKQLALPAQGGHLVVVRPGQGVWGQVLVDGNKFDIDGRSDGHANADVSHSVPAAGSKAAAPERFEKGDVIILIEPFSMQIYAAEVGAR
jgi:hypothetical protein